jgi:hypothetical protein
MLTELRLGYKCSGIKNFGKLWNIMLCSPKMNVLKPNPQNNGIKRGSLWEMITRFQELHLYEWDLNPYITEA